LGEIIVSHNCSLVPSGRQFQVDTGETILQAALRAGVVLPYGCKDGACGSCKSQIVAGEVDYGVYQSKAMSAAEREQGAVLICCATPRTDVVIKARVVAAEGMIPVRKMPCRVQSITRAAPDVAIVRLQLPANEKFEYLAGQYIDILLKDGKRRSYSMANAPLQENMLELHIRHMPGGAFTDALFGTATTSANPVRERDILRMEGPQGTFFLREDSVKPIILLASGTGFAPIKALVEQMCIRNIQRPIVLYWGGRRPHDLYMSDLAEGWASRLPNFRYVPVVSDALPEDQWSGRTGFVHRAVMADFPDLSGHQVYACGAPVVVDSARHDFTSQCGLPEDEFFADSFTSAADVAGS